MKHNRYLSTAAAAGIALFSIIMTPLSALAQATYTTDFEAPTFVLGNVQGQNGWGYLPNSPAKGIIETAPAGSPILFGAQSLAIRTNDVAFFGVSNQLYSALVDPAGETGSTIGGVVVAAPYNFYRATFYYQAPLAPVISGRSDGRFAELDPSSKGTAVGDASNRYAQIRVINNTNTALGKVRLEIGWYTNAATTFDVVTVVDNLNWGQWYRIDYGIRLCDGLQGVGPNDTFRVDVSDLVGNILGTVIGSTWESAWKTGSFGGGSTARAINGFDFWTQTGPNNAVVGYIDNFTQTATHVGNPCSLPTAGSVTVSGRVLNGRGAVAYARVTMTEADGTARAAETDTSGRYIFEDVIAGQTVSLQAAKRGLQFQPRVVTLNDNLADLDFFAERLGRDAATKDTLRID
jgi:hypothetical protein